MLKLTYQQVTEILWRLDHGETQADLAEEYGVSQGYISKLKHCKVKRFAARCRKPSPPAGGKGE